MGSWRSRLTGSCFDPCSTTELHPVLGGGGDRTRDLWFDMKKSGHSHPGTVHSIVKFVQVTEFKTVVRRSRPLEGRGPAIRALSP